MGEGVVSDGEELDSNELTKFGAAMPRRDADLKSQGQ
jgi:hypothetical protein